MVLRIRPGQKKKEGDGFQLKPERIVVVGERRTSEIKANVENSKIKLTHVTKKVFVKAEYVPVRRKFSAKSTKTILPLASIIVTLISIIITLLK